MDAVDRTPIASLTRMKFDAWRDHLHRGGIYSYARRFPRQTALILDGICNGVAIGFTGNRSISRSGVNLPSLDEGNNEELVAKVIAEDVAALKKAGPYDSPPFSGFACSPIGAVPKKRDGVVIPDKIRMIHHLSYPRHGDSVNANIEDTDTLKLASVGDAAKAIRRFGPNCWLIKLDVEAAYKQVPVRKRDWPLLGFSFRNKYYYERVLPFGLKSSCELWELFATALQHCIDQLDIPGCDKSQRVTIHYVDDFLFVVQTEQAARALLPAVLKLCDELGMPMALDKTVGPAQCLTFLGIELDTVSMQARLPPGRLQQLRELCEQWVVKEKASVAELQSLTGLLNYATAVVPAGRIFTRRIIDFTTATDSYIGSRHESRELSHGVRADVDWWLAFFSDPEWTGSSLLLESEWSDAPLIQLFTDACKTGYGAVFGTAWVAGEWSPEQVHAARRKSRISMPWLETLAIIIAAATWGHMWRGKKITFRSDCQSAVDALNGQRPKAPGLAHLVRELAHLAARHQFTFRAQHISGVANTVADALSRSDLRVQLLSGALLPELELDPQPAVVPWEEFSWQLQEQQQQ